MVIKLKYFIFIMALFGHYTFLCLTANPQEPVVSPSPKPEIAKDYLAEYKNTEVLVTLDQNQGKLPYRLLRLESDPDFGEVVIAKAKGSKGTLMIPIGDKRFSFKWVQNKDYQEGLRLLQLQDWEGAISVLRPHIYPLVKFLKLAEVDFDVPVGIYLNALVESEKWNESLDLLGVVPLKDLVNIDHKLLLEIFKANLRAKQINRVMFLANQLKILEKNDLQMQFANELRIQDYFPEALLMYQSLFQITDFSNATECQLWFYYCKLKQGINPSLKNQISALKPIDRSQKEYSLYRLLQGQVASIEEQYKKAILLLSEGLVYANLELSWVPELLYTTAKIYQKLEKTTAAKDIYQQVILFFKDSIWAKRSQEVLEKIDPRNLQAANQGHFLISDYRIWILCSQRKLLPKVFLPTILKQGFNTNSHSSALL